MMMQLFERLYYSKTQVRICSLTNSEFADAYSLENPAQFRPTRSAWNIAVPMVFHEVSALNEEVNGGQKVYRRNACTEYTDATFRTGSSLSDGVYRMIGDIVISDNTDFTNTDNLVIKSVAPNFRLNPISRITQNKHGDKL